MQLADGRDDLDIFLAREFGNGFRRFLGRDVDGARFGKGGRGRQRRKGEPAGKPVLAFRCHNPPVAPAFTAFLSEGSYGSRLLRVKAPRAEPGSHGTDRV